MQHNSDGRTEQSGRGLMLDGRKAYVKLDPSSWRAIDLLAMTAGVKWSDWVRSVWATATKDVEPEHRDEVNRAGVLRTFAIDQLLQQLETQRSMLNQLRHDGGHSNRIEIRLSDDLALVATNAYATSMAESIKIALALQMNTTG